MDAWLSEKIPISTKIINFSMLGLLRCLHRSQIQLNLQAQSEMTGIKYPQVCNHKSKDGKNSCADYSLNDVSDKKIGETVVGANLAAKTSVESLGIADLLQEHKLWNTIPIPGTDAQSDAGDSDSDLDSDEGSPTEALVKLTVQD